uniref:DUF7745 domain-containing protein n=1 Tax=Fagus sylvatica TaxID=28930 RepID=A0A2N9IQ69_FAGSY
MASSSNDPDSLVTLHFHDFRVERMRHWWTLLGEDDHADIVGIFGKFPPFMRLQVDRGLLEALASFWDPTHCCFSIGEVDLVPTLEEYAELPSARQPLQRDSVLRPEITRPEETWRKANISLDLLTKYFSRSDFPVELARDFIAGKKGMEEIPNQRLQDCLRRRQGEGVPMFCTQLLPALVLQSPAGTFYRLQTPYHFERHTCGCPWTHCALFDGVPLPGVWGCTGYYPSLALRQFGGVQYPPRLGLRTSGEAVLSEIVLIEDGSPGDSSVTSDFVEWREGWTPFFTLRPTSPCGVPCITTVWRWRTFAATWRLREGTSLLFRAMNEFIREQLEISEDAKDQLEETLAETREQLETEQALVDPTTGRPQDIVALRRALDASEEALTSARTSMGAMRVQISVLQGDNGVLQTELDLVHDALESNASWLNQEGFPVVTALHQINQVMDSLGARARAVLEEHDEGDPALSTALGRFCRETCIRLGH